MAFLKMFFQPNASLPVASETCFLLFYWSQAWKTATCALPFYSALLATSKGRMTSWNISASEADNIVFMHSDTRAKTPTMITWDVSHWHNLFNVVFRTVDALCKATPSPYWSFFPLELNWGIGAPSWNVTLLMTILDVQAQSPFPELLGSDYAAPATLRWLSPELIPRTSRRDPAYPSQQ